MFKLFRPRPHVLAGAVALIAVAGIAVGAAGAASQGSSKATATAAVAGQKLGKINHIVIIYEENHSFDNLYGGWEGVNGLANADAAHTTQINQSGAPFTCLLQNDVNLTSPPLGATCTDMTTGSTFSSAFPNGPFLIDSYIPSSATTCPKPIGAFFVHGVVNGQGFPGGCTEDIVHRYYQEQYQLNGGAQNRYVTGSDAAGLVMGHFDTKHLPIYTYLHGKNAPHYAIADNFFQGAFGGSFLNHQVLVSATAPVWPAAPTAGGLPLDSSGGSNDLHSVVDANGMPNNYPLYTSPLGATVRDGALTASCNPPAGRPATPAGVTCGDNAVNTIQPWNQPYAPGTAAARRLPALTTPNIGDELSAKGVDWAWYSGGWSNAAGNVGAPGWTNGDGSTGKCTDPLANASAVYPNCPDVNFQYHHQSFNYFATYAPGTAARATHLRDEVEFLADAQASDHSCQLRSVSFIKPIGEENEHPGYTSVTQGSNHLVKLLQAIEGSACAKDTMVVVSYDEFGGQWDHVPPPGQGSTTAGPHDEWGPSTRVPALILAPELPGNFVVDNTEHDTTSILSTIEHRFDVAPLTNRDATVPDLSSVWTARQVPAGAN
jgi:acid phosphatase